MKKFSISLFILLFTLAVYPVVVKAKEVKGGKSMAAKPDKLQNKNTERLMTGQAWADFCDRIKAAGMRVLQDDFPDSPRDRAEGFRYLARLVRLGLEWEIDYADPEFPLFCRIEEDLKQWGGPNIDNTYLRARIRGDSTYRLTGNIGTLHDIIISVHNGEMFRGKYGVRGDLDSSQLDIKPDGNFELILSPDRHTGNWFPLKPDDDHVFIRAYYYDWEKHKPGEFHIVKVGNEGKAPVPLEPAVLAERLDNAADYIERSGVYWKDWMISHSEKKDNVVGPAKKIPGGSSDALYGIITFNLAEDEALIIETVPPEARYWSFQYYTHAWFEIPDYANRLVSLNGHQAHVGSDGLVRIVVAHKDPGVPNWIDTGGRRKGYFLYRWYWSKNNPTPKCYVVKFGEIRNSLPADTPRVDEATRREEIERRRVHIERIFHQ